MGYIVTIQRIYCLGNVNLIKVGFHHTRIPIEYKATYTIGDIIGEGFIWEVSENGIALRTNQALVIGDKVSVLSNIKDNLILKFTGEIRNVQGNIVEILIKEIDQNLKQRFMHHIEGILQIMKKVNNEKLTSPHTLYHFES